MEIYSDTHPKITEFQLALIREAPVWRRMEIAGQMYETMKALSLAGLRRRFPSAGEDELKRRLADILLGSDLATKIFGPVPWGSIQNDNS